MMLNHVFVVSGVFDVLAYTDKDLAVPFTWMESDPKLIANPQMVKLHSFDTKVSEWDFLPEFQIYLFGKYRFTACKLTFRWCYCRFTKWTLLFLTRMMIAMTSKKQTKTPFLQFVVGFRILQPDLAFKVAL